MAAPVCSRIMDGMVEPLDFVLCEHGYEPGACPDCDGADVEPEERTDQLVVPLELVGVPFN